MEGGRGGGGGGGGVESDKYCVIFMYWEQTFHSLGIGKCTGAKT